MPIVCIERPNRTTVRRFTERDAGRIVNEIRRNGGNDSLLLAYLLQAYGLRSLFCVMLRTVDILNGAVFVGAMLSLLSGLITFLKGLKILLTGGRGNIISGIIQFLVPKKYLGQLGIFLTSLGALQALAASGVAFFSALTNSVVLFQMVKGACDVPITSFKSESAGFDLEELDAALSELQRDIFNFEQIAGE